MPYMEKVNIRVDIGTRQTGDELAKISQLSRVRQRSLTSGRTGSWMPTIPIQVRSDTMSSSLSQSGSLLMSPVRDEGGKSLQLDKRLSEM